MHFSTEAQTGYCLTAEHYRLLSDYGNCSQQILRDISPQLNVGVNFHYVASDDESFYPGAADDPSIWNGNKLATDILTFVNSYAANLLSHVNPLQQAAVLGDSKIRFELTAHPDDPADEHGGVWYHKTSPNVADLPSNTLNIIITAARSNANFTAQACGLGVVCNSMEYVKLGNDLRDDPSQNHAHKVAREILHELGHITGLCHSFAPDNPCSDVIPHIECSGTASDGGGGSCGGPAQPACSAGGSHTNSIMGYGGEKRHLTPCQYFTYYSFLYSMNVPFVRVYEIDCELLPPSGEQTIPTGTHLVYDELTIVNNNITIEANASLRVTCMVLMGPEISIHVKRGGKLIVDQGAIVNLIDGQPWQGITVEGNSAKIQPNPSLANPAYADPSVAGSVILNYAHIAGAKTAISTRSRNEWWREEYWGGLIAATNTRFVNNHRAVEFLKYELYADDFPNQSLVPNKSGFQDCTFEEVGDYYDGTYGLTMWRCNGISFKGCRFKNLDRTAIYGIDCGFKIENTTTSTLNQTRFEDNWRSIELFSTYSNNVYNVVIQDADFVRTSQGPNPNSVNHIVIESGSEFAGIDILGCSFSGGRYAVNVDGPALANVLDNVFENVARGVWFRNTGKSNSEINCNDMKANLVNISLIGDNRQTSFKYNEIQGGGQIPRVLVDGVGDISGRLRNNQGSSVDPARNCFETNRALVVRANAVPFYYHVHPQLAPPHLACVLIPEPANTPSGGNYEVAPSPFPLSSVEAAECGTGSGGNVKPDEETKQQLLQLRQGLAAVRLQVLNAPQSMSPAQLLAYENQESDYRALKTGLLEAYQHAGRFTDMEDILRLDFTEEDHRWLLGTHFLAGDWENARELANLLPQADVEQSSYKQVMGLVLNRMPENYRFDVSPAEEAMLWNIANGETASRSYARGVLALLRTAHFDPEDDDLDFQIPIQQMEGDGTSAAVFQRLFPNPTYDFVQVNATEGELEQRAMYRLLDISGRVVQVPTVIQSPATTVSLANHPQGIGCSKAVGYYAANFRLKTNFLNK